MTISVYVNTDAELDKEMLEALTRFEVQKCVVSEFETTEAQIALFLLLNYGDDLASKFKPEMMLKARGS